MNTRRCVYSAITILALMTFIVSYAMRENAIAFLALCMAKIWGAMSIAEWLAPTSNITLASSS